MTLDPAARRLVIEQFGLRLRAAREQAGLTQEQLADSSKIHRVTIARVEVGRREAGLTSICALANALGVEPGELLNGLVSAGPTDDITLGRLDLPRRR